MAQTLTFTLEPSVVYSDYACLISGLARGKRWCCRAASPCADVWRRIRHLIEGHRSLDNQDDPLCGWEVRKVKAHRKHVEKTSLPPDLRFAVWANELADWRPISAAAQDLFMAAVGASVTQAAKNLRDVLCYIHDLTHFVVDKGEGGLIVPKLT